MTLAGKSPPFPELNRVSGVRRQDTFDAMTMVAEDTIARAESIV